MSSILESYCKAWNAGDLDGIFKLFHKDAEYEGTSKRLRGIKAVRQMYQRTFESGAAKELRSATVQLNGGTWGVVLYKQAKVVAINEFTISGGLIVSHNLIDDPDAIARKLAV